MHNGDSTVSYYFSHRTIDVIENCHRLACDTRKFRYELFHDEVRK